VPEVPDVPLVPEAPENKVSFVILYVVVSPELLAGK
jgi:hypothetical protein